jgi:predicted nucleic acid-binding protein
VVYLVDTSAWHRVGNPTVADRWRTLLTNDAVAICDQVALEVLYSARSESDYTRTAANLAGLISVPIRAETFERAREVQYLLAQSGGLHHRNVTIADLVIAAAAEHGALPVLHYDEDYDRIAAITGQPTEWIAPRGSL